MKYILMTGMVLYFTATSFTQTAIKTDADSILGIIRNAGESNSFTELAEIIKFCGTHHNNSSDVSLALTEWLRESNHIYSGKSASQSNQFRVFLLYSLARFVPNDELYRYIRYELQFADYGFNIAAAAFTAKNFEPKAAELIPLFEPFFKSSFRDEYVEITSYSPEYPLSNPTRVRYEILQTLAHFGSSAYDAVPMISSLKAHLEENSGYNDTVLLLKCNNALQVITEATPVCCRKDNAVSQSKNELPSNRQLKNAREISLIDQEGKTTTFRSLWGKPYVLAFFYTRCTNPLKCLATVGKLANLQNYLNENHLLEQIGIYGMTLDPDYDNASVLKNYGQFYGMKFAQNVKFFQSDKIVSEFFNSGLELRVNYGFGSVNQHGSQLFIFDKRGRLVRIYDNEIWSVEDVSGHLKDLLRK